MLGKALSLLLKIFFVLGFTNMYGYGFILMYRKSSPLVQGILVILIHPCLCDFQVLFLQVTDDFKRFHIFYETLGLFTYLPFMNLYRRFLFSNTGDVYVTIALVILSGFEEILLRSTKESRDSYLRKMMRMRQLNKEELCIRRQWWSYEVTANSIIEITSIFVSAFMSLRFYNNRFAIDLGYGGFTDYNYFFFVTVMSTISQVLIELAVDYGCGIIEDVRGYEKTNFFFEYRNKEVFFLHFLNFIFAVHSVLNDLKTIPASIFCSDVTNPCTCPSYYVYQQQHICNGTEIFIVGESPSTTDAVDLKKLLAVLLSLLAVVIIMMIVYYLFKSQKNKKLKVISEISNNVLVSEEGSDEEVSRQASRMRHMKLMESDLTSKAILENSSIVDSMGKIENLIRGMPQAQGKLLRSLIEEIKKNALNPKKGGTVNVQSILQKNDNSQHHMMDSGTRKWLQTQLMSYDDLNPRGIYIII